MKKTGIIRKVDKLGRIVIPKPYRDILQIKESDPIKIAVQDSTLLLNKEVDTCVFCNSKDNLSNFQGKYLCNKCCQKFLAQILIK